MQRLFTAIFALTFATAAGCAEQPGKKKEDEETKGKAEGKVETKAINDGSKPAEAKPAEAKTAEAPK